VGTVGGLALLAGGTAIGSVSGTHSLLTTAALGLLAVGMGHALLDETRRQAHRGAAGGWAGQDTVNAVLLSAWATGALVVTVLPATPPLVRAVAGGLSMGYAVVCGYFVRQRRRAVGTRPAPATVATAPGEPAAG
jgi:hypothetical protein